MNNHPKLCVTCCGGGGVLSPYTEEPKECPDCKGACTRYILTAEDLAIIKREIAKPDFNPKFVPYFEQILNESEMNGRS